MSFLSEPIKNNLGAINFRARMPVDEMPAGAPPMEFIDTYSGSVLPFVLTKIFKQENLDIYKSLKEENPKALAEVEDFLEGMGFNKNHISYLDNGMSAIAFDIKGTDVIAKLSPVQNTIDIPFVSVPIGEQTFEGGEYKISFIPKYKSKLEVPEKSIKIGREELSGLLKRYSYAADDGHTRNVMYFPVEEEGNAFSFLKRHQPEAHYPIWVDKSALREINEGKGGLKDKEFDKLDDIYKKHQKDVHVGEGLDYVKDVVVEQAKAVEKATSKVI